MNPFEHFILTCFNVPQKSDRPSGQPMGLDAEGLSRRFERFERVCLPFMDRQTEGAFQWLVFMDWGTPVAFKEKMAALTVRHEFLRPVYCSQFDDEICLAEIRRREEPGKVRITTRLDPDAALHPRMIEHVQDLARDRLAAMDLKRGFFIGFPMGCIERKGDFYIRRERDNPFKSFVSSPECGKTVLGTKAGEPVVWKCTRPMWCQTVHNDRAGASSCGVYWPCGSDGEFAPVVLDKASRSVPWQCAEVVRSAVKCLLRR